MCKFPILLGDGLAAIIRHLSGQKWVRFEKTANYLGKFHHDLTVLPNPGNDALVEGNHRQVAQQFRIFRLYSELIEFTQTIHGDQWDTQIICIYIYIYSELI